MAGFGLVVGIGWAHERFAIRGITEVALAWLASDLGAETTWSVRETNSLIFVTGEPADVRYAVARLRARLDGAGNPVADAALSSHKITAGNELDGNLLVSRFGAQGYGLAGVIRFGYGTTGPAEVAGWLAAPGFQTSSTFQGGVEIDWPQGNPNPARDSSEPSREPVRTPGWIPAPDGLEISWLARRTPTAELAGYLLDGVITGAVPATTPTAPGCLIATRQIGADARHISVVALEPSSGHATLPALAAIRTLIDAGPSELQILAAIDRSRGAESQASADVAFRAAVRSMWQAEGYAMPPDESLSTDPAELGRAVRQLVATLSLRSPVDPAGSGIGPSSLIDQPGEAAGRTFDAHAEMKELGLGPPHRLVAGGSALTRYPGPLTVTAGTVAVVERRPDGERILYGRDGSVVSVDPLLWKRGDGLVSWVDAEFPQQITNPERLPTSPIVHRALLRTRPGVYYFLIALCAIAGPGFAVGFVTAPADRSFLVVIAIFFFAVLVVIWRLLGRYRRLKQRVATQ